MDYQNFKNELNLLGTNKTYSATHILNLTIELLINFLNSSNSLPISFREDISLVFSLYHSEMSIYENLLKYLNNTNDHWTKGSLKNSLTKYKQKIDQEEKNSIKKLVIELRKSNIRNIITISYSNLVLKSILEYIKTNKLESVLVASSPPKFEGVQFVKDFYLASKTTKLILIDDGLLASQMRTMKVNAAVVIGCDSIFADGSIINKSGSYMLAILCNHFNIPFFVIGSEMKKRNQNFDQNVIKLQELTDLPWFEEELKQKEIHIVNRYFDHISKDLITKIFY